jgi:UDP-N-acetylglucosamine transferase subunit ALG13|tara:strand:- start:4588 stop:5079 length:492 start_codon:yes stop_codon:yes gene_type:complete
MKEVLPDIFVTVGFHTGFLRLVRKIDELAPKLGAKVVMQIGNSSYQPKNTEFFRFAPSLHNYINKADLVISHGAMTVIEAIRASKPVIIVPRQARYGEHINDHQVEFSETLETHPAVEVVHDVNRLEVAIQQISRKFIVVKFDDSNRIRLVRALREFVRACGR